jgi:hypothetical protein
MRDAVSAALFTMLGGTRASLKRERVRVYGADICASADVASKMVVANEMIVFSFHPNRVKGDGNYQSGAGI